MAEILIKTINNCVGSVKASGPEITLPKGRVVHCEEKLARKFIALDGAVEATEADLLAQDISDAERADIEARAKAALG